MMMKCCVSFSSGKKTVNLFLYLKLARYRWLCWTWNQLTLCQETYKNMRFERYNHCNLVDFDHYKLNENSDCKLNENSFWSSLVMNVLDHIVQSSPSKSNSIIISIQFQSQSSSQSQSSPAYYCVWQSVEKGTGVEEVLKWWLDKRTLQMTGTRWTEDEMAVQMMKWQQEFECRIGTPDDVMAAGWHSRWNAGCIWSTEIENLRSKSLMNFWFMGKKYPRQEWIFLSHKSKVH